MSDTCRHGYPIDGDGSPGDRCHECLIDDGFDDGIEAAAVIVDRWGAPVAHRVEIAKAIRALVKTTKECSPCCGTGHTSGVYAGASMAASKCRDCDGTGRVKS